MECVHSGEVLSRTNDGDKFYHLLKPGSVRNFSLSATKTDRAFLLFVVVIVVATATAVAVALVDLQVNSNKTVGVFDGY